MKRHLDTIRQSDRETKKRWVVGLSGGVVLIVIILWFMYMQAFIFTSSQQNTDERLDVGFYQTFKEGLGVTRVAAHKRLVELFNKIPSFGANRTTIENPN